jgi:hypothetical protein
MGILGALTRIFGRGEQSCGQAAEPVEAPAPPVRSRSLLDCRPDVSADDIILGVKYVSRYAWHILPPAGWRRQESNAAQVWPATGSSPWVTFLNQELKPPEQAMIRWQLLSVPETASSHDLLEELICDSSPLFPASVEQLEAPGLVAGMKVQKVERVDIGDAMPALLIAARLEQCKGEPAVLRYVLIFPDRRVLADSEPRWYRESLQYIATENSFWSSEPSAVAALKTFRRTTDTQSASGTFAAVQAPSPTSVR